MTSDTFFEKYIFPPLMVIYILLMMLVLIGVSAVIYTGITRPHKHKQVVTIEAKEGAALIMKIIEKEGGNE